MLLRRLLAKIIYPNRPNRSHIFRVSILCCVYICITLNTHECMYIDTAFLSSARFHGGYIRSYPCCVYICTNRSIDTPWCVPCRGKTWFFVDMVVLYPNSGVLYEGAKPCWRVGEDEIRVGQVRMDVFFEMSQIRAYVLVGKVFNFTTKMDVYLVEIYFILCNHNSQNSNSVRIGSMLASCLSWCLTLTWLILSISLTKNFPTNFMSTKIYPLGFLQLMSVVVMEINKIQ